MNFLFITNKPDIAKYAVNSGVDRIFIDLEINGKMARQGHLNTVINHHDIDDIPAIRAEIPKGSLLVRVNPWDTNSTEEIKTVINMGADHIMLPMFRDIETAKLFIDTVYSINSNANPILLVETKAAFDLLPSIMELPITEFYIGLNDLSIDSGLSFLFEPLAQGWIDPISTLAQQKNIKFGFGGIGRLGEGMLSADLILSEHVRLNSHAVILSRAFHKNSTTISELESHLNLSDEITALRERIKALKALDSKKVDENTHQLQTIVAQIATEIATTAQQNNTENS